MYYVCLWLEYESAYGYNEIRQTDARSDLEASDQKTVYETTRPMMIIGEKEPDEWTIISDMETQERLKRVERQLRRVKRVKAMMARGPDEPENLRKKAG